MLKQLREQVLEANLEVVRRGLVLYTFGNVSGISREDNLVVIKPSGVPYERMKADDLVITDLDGKVVWGELRPSSDLETHIHLYKSFPTIGGVVHTHSEHRHRLGAGLPRDSGAGHHPCRLLLRPGADHRPADGRGDQGRLCARDGRRHHGGLRQPRPDGGPRSPGRRTRPLRLGQDAGRRRA